MSEKRRFALNPLKAGKIDNLIPWFSCLSLEMHEKCTKYPTSFVNMSSG